MFDLNLDPTVIALAIGVLAFIAMHIATRIRDLSNKESVRNLGDELTVFQEREASWDAEAIFRDSLVEGGNGSEVSRQEFLDSGNIYDITRYRSKRNDDH